MAYFPASCDYDCKECSQNKCGWCAFLDRQIMSEANQAVTINLYNYSTTVANETNKEDEK